MRNPKSNPRRQEAILKYGPAHNKIIQIDGLREWNYPTVNGVVVYTLYKMVDGKIIGLPEDYRLKGISTRCTKIMIKNLPDGLIWADFTEKHNSAISKDDGRLLYRCITEEFDTTTYHSYYTPYW